MVSEEHPRVLLQRSSRERQARQKPAGHFVTVVSEEHLRVLLRSRVCSAPGSYPQLHGDAAVSGTCFKEVFTSQVTKPLPETTDHQQLWSETKAHECPGGSRGGELLRREGAVVMENVGQVPQAGSGEKQTPAHPSR